MNATRRGPPTDVSNPELKRATVARVRHEACAELGDFVEQASLRGQTLHDIAGLLGTARGIVYEAIAELPNDRSRS